MLVACAHLANAAEPEHWADEPVSRSAESTPEPPVFGPVIGAYLGGSFGHRGPDVGGRLGLRWRAARHMAMSFFVDVAGFEYRRTECFSVCIESPVSELVTYAMTMARLELVTDGHLGPFFVPGLTLGAFFGGGAGFFPWADASVLVKGGLHVAVTRLPSGLWFPVFIDISVLGAIDEFGGSNTFSFAGGIAL